MSRSEKMVPCSPSSPYIMIGAESLECTVVTEITRRLVLGSKRPESFRKGELWRISMFDVRRSGSPKRRKSSPEENSELALAVVKGWGEVYSGWGGSTDMLRAKLTRLR